MVSRAFKQCLLLVEKMVKHNYVNQIDRKKLEDLIGMYIGVDKRTKRQYVCACVDFELLQPNIVKKGEVTVYAINLMKADKLMNEVFGRNLRQLMLFEPKS